MARNTVRCTFGYECNNSCVYCTVSSTRKHKNQPLSASDIPKLLERIRSIKDVDVEISGGEPTLKPETFYLLEQLRETAPDVNCTILTNGRRFSRASIVSRISNFPPRLVIPLHADTPQIHDAITRVDGSFNETMLGIKNLYEYNLPVDLKIVVSKQNYERLPMLVEMLAQKFPPCRGIIMNRVIFNSGRSLENKHLAAVRISDTLPYVKKAIDIGKQYGFKAWVYCIPPCILGEEYKNYLGKRYLQTIVGNDAEHVKDGRVDDKCKPCRYASECGTVWSNYFETYGTDEIDPIK